MLLYLNKIIFLIVLLLLKYTSNQEQVEEVDAIKQRINNMKNILQNEDLVIETKHQLRLLFEKLLNKNMEKTYDQFNEAEKVFYDIFLTNMVESVNEADYSLENIAKYLSEENIDFQKEAALVQLEYQFDDLKKKDEEEMNKMKPQYDEFYDENFEDDNNIDDKEYKNGFHSENNINLENKKNEDL